MNKRTNILNPILHLAGAASVALVAVGFYALAYRPLVAQGLSDQNRIAQLRMLQDQAGTVHREHRRLRDELATMQRAIQSVRERTPPEALVVEFVSDVREIAESLGVQVTDHRMAPTRTADTHSESEVHVRCVGDYASICRFLHKVENLARIVKVSSLSINQPASDGRQRVEMTFVLYYGVKSNDTDEKG